jgi:hypothetical protein
MGYEQVISGAPPEETGLENTGLADKYKNFAQDAKQLIP